MENRRMTNPIPKVQSAAYKIFHYYFDMIVAQMHLMTFEFTGLETPISSGDRDFDRDTAHMPAHCRLTINDMVEFHRQGVSMRFQNPKDSVRVYEIVQQHLTDWIQALKHNVNVNDTPIEDLLLMDEFLELVYDVAKHYVTEPRTNNAFERFLGRHTLGRRGRRLSDTQIAQMNAQGEEASKTSSDTLQAAPVVKPHSPMAEALREAHEALQSVPLYRRNRS